MDATTIELTNYEALHGWARIVRHIGWASSRPSVVVSPALRSAARKLDAAYGERTATATTVALTAEERAAVADVLAPTELERRIGRRTNATPHVESMLAKLTD